MAGHVHQSACLIGQRVTSGFRGDESRPLSFVRKMAAVKIPVLDIEELLENKDDTSEVLHGALCTVGFVYLVNHGISEELVRTQVVHNVPASFDVHFVEPGSGDTCSSKFVIRPCSHFCQHSCSYE